MADGKAAQQPVSQRVLIAGAGLSPVVPSKK